MDDYVSLILMLIGAIAQSLIFLFFCISLTRLLKTHNSQSNGDIKRLDNYLITTLLLIGLSVLFLLAMSIIDIAEGTNKSD
jgi:peptidoglycan biosynthesis protein MviN/MurJ (putative lipid II flippase)